MADFRTRQFYPKESEWRSKCKEIEAARKELKEYSGMMTDYERAIAQRAIREIIDQHGPYIIGNMVKELDKAREKFESARVGVNVAKIREINRWDAEKLMTEMNFIKARVEQAIASGGDGGVFSNRPTTAAQMEIIYREAQLSGDLIKQRAACEVFSGISERAPRGDSEERSRINAISRQANSDLQRIRNDTPEIRAATQEAEGAWADYLKVNDEARAVNMTVNGEDPENPFAIGDISRTMRRVAVDRYTNEVVIYDADDPEVTGIVWRYGKEEVKDDEQD